MSRLVRQILFASMIACHAAVTLFGPCLHGLPGLSHTISAASKPHGSDDPLQSPRDATDRCLICHFVAQAQLPVEFSSEPSVPLVDELVITVVRVTQPLSNPLPACPRAPPMAISGLS
jgi:hypothetical protein